VSYLLMRMQSNGCWSSTFNLTSERGIVRMWDAQTLEQRYFVRHGPNVSSIEFNASGDRFFTLSNSELRLWEAETGRLMGRLTLSRSSFKGAVWRGNHIFNWYGAVVGLWDGSAPENVAAVCVCDDSFLPHRASVSWNAERTRFLTWNAAGVEIPVVRVWAVEGQFDDVSLLLTLPHDDERIDGAAWSSDETMIASWSQNRVNIWDVETGALRHEVNTGSYVTEARWSPNSRYLLVTDIREQTARVWDARTGEEVLTIAPGTDAMWDTTGERLLAGRQTLLLLDVPSGETLAEFGSSLGFGYGLWNPDGVRMLVESAFGVQVWLIPPPDRCVVHALAPANLRAEPDTDSPRVDVLLPRQLIAVSGQAVDADSFIWWQLENSLWVRSDVVEETGRCEADASLTAALRAG
jgi:WD40 repeat protein